MGPGWSVRSVCVVLASRPALCFLLLCVCETMCAPGVIFRVVGDALRGHFSFLRACVFSLCMFWRVDWGGAWFSGVDCKRTLARLFTHTTKGGKGERGGARR